MPMAWGGEAGAVGEQMLPPLSTAIGECQAARAAWRGAEQETGEKTEWQAEHRRR